LLARATQGHGGSSRGRNVDGGQMSVAVVTEGLVVMVAKEPNW
jgi:hypothetical protein